MSTDFKTSSRDTALWFDRANYITYNQPVVMTNRFNTKGVYYYGLDFARTDGRDADIWLMNIVGREDKGAAYCKINVVGGTDTTQMPTANQWYKLRWTTTTSSTAKMLLGTGAGAGNRFTYLATAIYDLWHVGDFRFTRSGTASGVLSIAIIQGGNTASPIAQFDSQSMAGGAVTDISINAYLEDIAKNNYYEIWAKTTRAGDYYTTNQVQQSIHK
jgi:hypothetical protein